MSSFIPANLADQAKKATPDAIKSKLNEVNSLSNYLKMTLAQKQPAAANGQDLGPLLDTIKGNLDRERATLQQMIDSNKTTLQAQEKEISVRQEQIKTKEQILMEHDNDVNNQKSLMILRDRMLQLSQEKNVWKQKVIYVLLSLIIAVFLIMIAGYAFSGGKSDLRRFY